MKGASRQVSNPDKNSNKFRVRWNQAHSKISMSCFTTVFCEDSDWRNGPIPSFQTYSTASYHIKYIFPLDFSKFFTFSTLLFSYIQFLHGCVTVVTVIVLVLFITLASEWSFYTLSWLIPSAQTSAASQLSAVLQLLSRNKPLNHVFSRCHDSSTVDGTSGVFWKHNGVCHLVCLHGRSEQLAALACGHKNTAQLPDGKLWSNSTPVRLSCGHTDASITAIYPPIIQNSVKK